MERRLMTLLVCGAAADMPGREAREDLCRASGAWIERAEIRRPDRVRVIAGGEKASPDDDKAFGWLNKSIVPVTVCVAVQNISAVNAIASAGLKVDTTEVCITGEPGDGVLSKIRETAFPGRLEVSFVLDGMNTGSVEKLIDECAASADEERGARVLTIIGGPSISADEIMAVRSHAAGWWADASDGRTELRFERVPLCAVPRELQPYAHAACGDGAAEPDAASLPRECARCMLWRICDFPVRGVEQKPGAEVLVPLNYAAELKRHVRGVMAERIRAEAEDALFRLPVFGGCNNRCEDCPDKVFAKPGTSTRNALKLLTKAWSSGAVTVAFTDGEPSLRKDLPSLLKAAGWYGLNVRLHTNARMLSVGAFVRELSRHRNLTVVARLAGHDAASHDGCTRSESFAQAVAGVRNAVASGLRTELHFRLRPDIAADAGALLRLGAELGAPIVIDVPSHWSYFPDACTYSDLMRGLEAALDEYFAEGGVGQPVFVQGAPLCLMGKYQGLYLAVRGAEFAKPPVCEGCSVASWCCGLPERYTLEFGSSELRPDIANSDSSLRFSAAGDMAGFDLEDCGIKAGRMETPGAGNHLIVRNGGSYQLFESEDNGLDEADAVAVKNFGRGGAAIFNEGVECGLRLCAECALCPKLAWCAACFVQVDEEQHGVEIESEARTLLVRRDETSVPPPGVAVDDTILFREFWTRMSRGGAGMPMYRTIVVHDSADFFPSAERAMWHIANVAPRGCRVIVTGRNMMPALSAERGRDCVPAIQPWGIRTGGTALRLTGSNTRGRFWSLEFMKEDAPAAAPAREKLASFFVIRACVARCVMCNVQNFFSVARMPLVDVMRGLDELRINGFEYVDIFGGEVTLREDLCFIVRYASGIGLKPMIITTGHSLDEVMVRALRDAGAVKVSVSLDADEAPLHDMIKGAPGLFARALDAIAAASRTPGLEVNVNTVVMPENFNRVAEIVKLAGSRGADVARFFLCVSSPAASPVRKVLDSEQLSELVDVHLPRAKEAAARMGMEIDFRPEPPDARTRDEWIARVSEGHYNPLTPDVAGTCAAPDVRTLVDVDGAVYPCEVPLMFASEHVLGNIAEEPLVKILNSEAMKAFREKSGRVPECEMCFGAMPLCGWESE